MIYKYKFFTLSYRNEKDLVDQFNELGEQEFRIVNYERIDSLNENREFVKVLVEYK